MNEELKINIRQKWLFSLFEFAHIDFQRRLWIDASYSLIIGSYSEAIASYFDDLSLSDGYEDLLKEKIISQEEFDIIKDFHLQLDNYISKPDKANLKDKNILRDIEWVNLTILAKNNWEKIKEIIQDAVELKYMKNLENQYLTIKTNGGENNTRS